MNKILAVSGVVMKELYRRKDFYVLFILTVLITGLLGSMNFFHDDDIVRFIKEICLFLILVSVLVITVTTTARQIPSERESRTIFPLLAKPISRWQMLVGKFFGCWAASGVALLVFYVFFALVSVSREHSIQFGAYADALWLHWQMLGIVIALTLLGSILLSHAANVTVVFIITIGILLLGGFLHRIASQTSEPMASILTVIYFCIPHLEFFDMRELIIHDWAGLDIPAPVYVLGATLYGFTYIAMFLLAACLAFRRKALN